jgi:hypothetical protein
MHAPGLVKAAECGRDDTPGVATLTRDADAGAKIGGRSAGKRPKYKRAMRGIPLDRDLQSCALTRLW